MSVSIPIDVLGLQPDGYSLSGWPYAAGVLIASIIMAVCIFRSAQSRHMAAALLVGGCFLALCALGIHDDSRRQNQVLEIMDQAVVVTTMNDLGLNAVDVPQRSLENVTKWTFYQDEDKIRVDGSAEHLLPNGRTPIAKVTADRTQITYSVR